MSLWLQLYKYIFMTSLMTSPGNKIGQILKLIYLRQYLSYSVDQKLKMSEMLMAIFLVYSTSGITSDKKSLSRAQNGGHFEHSKWQTQLQFDLRYEKIVPDYAKKYFFNDDVIDGVTGWPQSRPFIFLCKWNNNVFHDNLKTSKDIIIKLPVHRYHERMTTII